MRTILVGGKLDTDVPAELVELFYDEIADKENVEIEISASSDHFDLLDASKEIWCSILFPRIVTTLKLLCRG